MGLVKLRKLELVKLRAVAGGKGINIAHAIDLILSKKIIEIKTVYKLISKVSSNFHFLCNQFNII